MVGIKKIGKGLGFVGVFFMIGSCSMAAMRYATDDVIIKSGVLSGTTDWGAVISKTVNADTITGGSELYSQNAVDVVESAVTGERTDWNEIGDKAKRGNPIAQYAFAQYLFNLASTEFNGIRTKIRAEAYMYALISAIKGNYTLTKEDYFTETDIPDAATIDSKNLISLAKTLGDKF
jgi:hypothetical protein